MAMNSQAADSARDDAADRGIPAAQLTRYKWMASILVPSRMRGMYVKPLEKKELHFAAGIRARAKKARRDDARCVAHEDIPRVEVARDVGKHFVRNGFCFSIIDQKPGCTPFLRRRLRDELRRKVVIKIACFQRMAPFPHMRARKRPAWLVTSLLYCKKAPIATRAGGSKTITNNL